MRPLSKKDDKRIELFRERLENILNQRHELYRLAGLIDWDLFEKEFGKFYSEKKGRSGFPSDSWLA